MTITVRGLVRDMQAEVLATDLQPDRAAELLTKLTALLGNVLDEMRVADAEYNLVLLKHLESEEAASRAKIRAETTGEYARKREARDVHALAMQLIMSLKVFVRGKAEEARLTR